MGLFSKKKQQIIVAAQSGTVVNLTEVTDPVFAQKILGDGIAIIPDSNEVLSPCDGTVVQIADTRHAVGIESDDGLEVLVHLGIDTVKLVGEGFTCFVKVGQHVKVGDKLMEMDLELIKSKNLNLISPCIITNMDDVENLKLFTGTAIAGETTVMSYQKS